MSAEDDMRRTRARFESVMERLPVVDHGGPSANGRHRSIPDLDIPPDVIEPGEDAVF